MRVRAEMMSLFAREVAVPRAWVPPRDPTGGAAPAGEAVGDEAPRSSFPDAADDGFDLD